MTVRARLTLVVTVLFALVLLLASVGLVQAVERGGRDDVESSLRVETEQLRIRLTNDPQDPLPVGPAGERFLVVGASGDVVAASPGLPADTAQLVEGTWGVTVRGPVPAERLADGAVAQGGATELVTDPAALPAGGVALLSVPLSDVGSRIIASVSLEPLQQSIDQLVRILLFAVPALIGLVGGASWLLVGRALQPVESIIAQVDRITASTLAARVPETGTGDEIEHLARTMNRMLERLEIAGAAQQRFTADASHELRSPLTAMRTEIEATLLDTDAPDWPATARRVLAETSHLERLVADLLLLARLDAGVSPQTSEVDLDDLVVVRAGGLADVTLDLHPVKVRANPDQLAAVVRNLVDNARRHARSQVRVSTVVEGTDAVLVIQDDGPGIAAADRARVLEPFVRLQEARTRGDAGSGLGLALVDRIVRAHGWTLRLGESASGGLRVEVLLPAVPLDPNPTPVGRYREPHD